MNKKVQYQIGLDLGVASVGWAVVDNNNKLIRKKGKNLWGVRLFDEADSAEERRLKRRQRRTISKRAWRLSLLRNEIKDYVFKEDPKFFERIKTSYKKPKEQYSLFNGNYTDAHYLNEFPTIFHLRLALMDKQKVEQYLNRGIYYRLLYLAINDILKARGHFLTEGKINTKQASSKDKILKDAQRIIEYINEQEQILDEKFIIDNVKDILDKEDDFNKRKQDANTTFLKAILGNKFNLNKILEFSEEKLDFSFDDENWEENLTTIDEANSLLYSLYDLYSTIRLSHLLGDEPNISSSKVKIYQQHKIDLRDLKIDIKKVDKLLGSEYYFELFEDEKSSVSYSRYVGKIIKEDKKIRIPKLKGNRHEQLIKKLVKIKDELNKTHPKSKLLANVTSENYLLIPTNSDNRLIPYQLHYNELDEILNMFVEFDKTAKSKQIKKNILKIMEFKVPYFVGPLSNKHSDKDSNYWLVKNKGYENVKVTPFNFDEVVDKKATNQKFIKRMLRSCTYLHNEFCMQQETILYQLYIFYNTVNKIKINDAFLTSEQKDILLNYFINRASITKRNFLKLLNIDDAEVAVFNDADGEKNLQLSLNSLKRFKQIFPDHFNNNIYRDFFDDVINEISFIDDNEINSKKETIIKLAENYQTISLTDGQIEQLVKVKSKKWGNLSYKLLNELLLLKDAETGELDTIMNILKTSNMNLMEILFIGNNMETIDNLNDFDVDLSTHENLHNYLKNKYISPQARRAIIQTTRVVDEIIKIMGGVKPTKIAIEFTRENQIIKRQTSPRFKQLQSAYKNINEEYKIVLNQLSELDKNKQQDYLRRKKIYLYFLQLGKDIYTGENIDFNALISNSMKYNIDHIFPQSRIKDDSFDNTVLTQSVINGEKGNNYPLPENIRKNNISFWNYLKEKGLMSSKKHSRLIRDTKLTDQELEDFVNRQKTTLDWINLETAELLNLKYGPKTKDKNFIVFSKSNHVYTFRNKFKLLKFRELNDLHHAHDAYLNIIVGKAIQQNLYVDFEGRFRTYNYERILERQTDEQIGYIKKIFNYHDLFITKRTKINNKGSYWDELMVSPKKSGSNLNLRPIKRGMDVNKYGGYNSASTAFFSILEKENKKTIVPIEVAQCSYFYNKDKFNRQKFESYINRHFPGYKIVEAIVPISQKVVVNKVPLLLAGKTGNRIVFHNTSQLILDKDTYNYLRSLAITRNRYKGQKMTEEILLSRNINFDDNFLAFKKLAEKIALGYEKFNLFTENTYTKVVYGDTYLSDFKELSLLEQYNSLLIIITRLIKPNSSNKAVLFNKSYNDFTRTQNITYNFSLIKESITGFYSKRVDIHVQDSSN